MRREIGRLKRIRRGVETHLLVTRRSEKKHREIIGQAWSGVAENRGDAVGRGYKWIRYQIESGSDRFIHESYSGCAFRGRGRADRNEEKKPGLLSVNKRTGFTQILLTKRLVCQPIFRP